MAANNVIGIVCNDLYKSFCGINGKSLTIGTIVSAVQVVFNTFTFAFIFCDSYRSHLRCSKDSCRHDIETNIILTPEDMVNCSKALECCSMCKHLPSVNIADSIYSRQRCLHIVIDDYCSPVNVYAYAFEIKTFGVWFASSGHQDNISFYGSFLSLAIEDYLPIIYALNSRLHIECNTLFLHTLSESLCYITINSRKTFF